MFDRFQICEAYFIVASRWHSGQGSKGYAILSRLTRMGYCPRPMEPRRGDDVRNAAAALLWNRRREVRATW